MEILTVHEAPLPPRDPEPPGSQERPELGAQDGTGKLGSHRRRLALARPRPPWSSVPRPPMQGRHLVRGTGRSAGTRRCRPGGPGRRAGSRRGRGTGATEVQGQGGALGADRPSPLPDPGARGRLGTATSLGPLSRARLPRGRHKGDARHPPGPAWQGPQGRRSCSATGGAPRAAPRSAVRGRVSALRVRRPARSRPLFPSALQPGRTARGGRVGGGAEWHKDAGSTVSARAPPPGAQRPLPPARPPAAPRPRPRRPAGTP
ncbi:proline-rich protein 2-like [Mesoplodon densirostris]|uniref:proline-rich protein 2-like n=1 Tax=Mesoplodon densirostris TaxID=48708 RepID=UPI0028DAF8F3|nr:proline-rich protein 2-like [Mesoplodon densirostris]